MTLGIARHHARAAFVASLASAVLAVGGVTVAADAASTSKAAKPTISGVTVTSGPSTGGTRVTVKGTNLIHVSAVTFGGTKGTKLKVSTTHKSLLITTPAHLVGAVDVRVKTTAGTSVVTSKDTYSYRAYVSISAGGDHSCAIDNGHVRCWGYNNDGQLGNGSTTPAPTPDAVVGITHAVAVSAGELHTCALILDGTVRCWGDNAYGKLGNNSTVRSLVPVQVSGLHNVVALSAGSDHTCTVISDGTARCWGFDSDGALGNTSSLTSRVPVQVSGLTHATAISASTDFTCALRADGTARCWGYNLNGQLGNGTGTTSLKPVHVRGLTGATAISTGTSHACAVASGGSVLCWGYGGYGQLGTGTTAEVHTPTAVAGLTAAAGVAAGGYDTCAIEGGHAFCWGDDFYGEVGDANSGTHRLTAAAVVDLGTVSTLTLGTGHTCARLTVGALRCWGYNVFGQLGNGTTNNSTVPVPVGG
jgi:Regulator of chromosome condensation (RCC1) repeat/IPT/TIG domain